MIPQYEEAARSCGSNFDNHVSCRLEHRLGPFCPILDAILRHHLLADHANTAAHTCHKIDLRVARCLDLMLDFRSCHFSDFFQLASSLASFPTTSDKMPLMFPWDHQPQECVLVSVLQQSPSLILPSPPNC